VNEPDPRWPDLPIYERDPKQTCSTCAFLVRLRQGPTDIKGAYVCKLTRPSITSLPQQNGVVGIAADFVPQQPWQWCFEWICRTPAPSAVHRLRLLPDVGGNPEVEKTQSDPNSTPNP
jgi:hypothetical protein